MRDRVDLSSSGAVPTGKGAVAKRPDVIPASYHTVAVGSGPVGLLSALSALQHCKSGEKVAILADRREELGVRQQVLWIQDDVFEFIKKMVGEELITRFMSELAITEDEDDGYYLTTGDFERLLYTALSEYDLGTDYDFIDVQKIGPQQRITDVIQIDKEKQTISVQGLSVNGVALKEGSKTCSLNFKNLVAADGARRTIAKAMGEDDVIFDETQRTMHHTKHVVATFRLPEGTTPQACSKLKVYPGATGAEAISKPVIADIPFSRDITPRPLSELRSQFGWKGYTRPHSQIYATRDVVYIGAEMPADLPKEKAREYAIMMMHDQLPKDYINKISEVPCDLSTAYGRKMQQLKVSVFDIELGELNKTLQVCANEAEDEYGVIFYMGDAKKNPLYTTGTGVQTGVREVMGFDTYLDSVGERKPGDKRTDKIRMRDALETYHAHTQELLSDIRKKQDDWIEGRVKKEKDAEMNFKLFTQHKQVIENIAVFIRSMNEDHARLVGSEIPEFFGQLHMKLNALKEKHNKIFLCLGGEESITSYNGVEVQGMINEFKILERDILSKYLPVELEGESLVKKWYKEFVALCKLDSTPKATVVVSPVKLGIFSDSNAVVPPRVDVVPKIDGLTM